MNEEQKFSSEQKKQALRNKLTVEQQSTFLITWWLEIANSIKNAGAKWSLAYLEVVNQDQHDYWVEKLTQDPWTSFSFPADVICNGDSYWVHEMLYSRYPSSLPLRYLPSIEIFKSKEVDTSRILKTIIDQNGLSNQVIFLLYVRMSPVIKMDLYDILTLDAAAILPELEDAAIIALDGSWLIFKSLEQEWLFGRI